MALAIRKVSATVWGIPRGAPTHTSTARVCTTSSSHRSANHDTPLTSFNAPWSHNPHVPETLAFGFKQREGVPRPEMAKTSLGILHVRLRAGVIAGGPQHSAYISCWEARRSVQQRQAKAPWSGLGLRFRQVLAITPYAHKCQNGDSYLSISPATHKVLRKAMYKWRLDFRLYDVVSCSSTPEQQEQR
jgi:hypothetical protein